MSGSERDLEILDYLNSLVGGPLVEDVLISIKSDRDVNVVVKVKHGMLIACMAKVESDMYCRRSLKAKAVNRSNNSDIKILTDSGHTYYLKLKDTTQDNVDS